VYRLSEDDVVPPKHVTVNRELSLGDSSPLCSMYTSKEQRFTSQNTTSIMDIYFI